MHILITGGTGLIGSALCKALLAEGHRLTVLTRSKSQDRAGLRFISEFSQCADTVDAVINLAGAGLADRRWTPLINGRLGRVVWILPMILSRGCLSKKHRRSA